MLVCSAGFILKNILFLNYASKQLNLIIIITSIYKLFLYHYLLFTKFKKSTFYHLA